MEIQFHENYPEQSPNITITDSANVDDTEAIESEINKIVSVNKCFSIGHNMIFLHFSVKKI